MADIQISVQGTPNPNTLKFLVNRDLIEGIGIEFSSRAKAEESALAKAIFEFDWVTAVYVGRNFVSITKSDSADWNALVGETASLLRQRIGSGAALVADAGAEHYEDQSPVAVKIRQILDRDIRPAVAMDGGDIRFVAYEDGVVKLHLRGSCSSCPSSIMTLRMGVENRLRAEIPEIKEVVQV